MNQKTLLTDIPDSIRQGATQEEWEDYTWQLRHSFNSIPKLEAALRLSTEERNALLHAAERLAVSITPYFLSLIDPDNPCDPLRRQVIPHMDETIVGEEEMADPCGEDGRMVAPGLVHRYPDRVLLLATDRCASYCRHCTRSRVVSGVTDHKLRTDWDAAFDYIRRHEEIRDVLLSGGDPLLLPDSRLDSILSELRSIPHIEFLRIGSRIPIFLPQRITDSLCATLRKHAPLFLSVHVNHPSELTGEAEEALVRLADHGIPLGSQTVLLKGINDDIAIQRPLYHRLLQCRVRPYYLYQCDLIEGSRHFRTTLQAGIDIISALRGHTSGYAIPQYVVDAPGGGGKIPVNPDYIVEQTDDHVTLRNYAGQLYTYPLFS